MLSTFVLRQKYDKTTCFPLLTIMDGIAYATPWGWERLAYESGFRDRDGGRRRQKCVKKWQFMCLRISHGGGRFRVESWWDSGLAGGHWLAEGPAWRGFEGTRRERMEAVERYFDGTREKG
jgi:hypothetical protein